MSLLRKRARPIAVDFGSCGLRLLQLAGQDGQVRVVAAACHPYPPGERGEAPDRGTVTEALRTSLRKAPFVGDRVVSALSDQELRTKSFRLPDMPEAELTSAVRYEALERIAGLEEDDEIRFIPAGSIPGGTDTQQEVIVLAAPAAVVARRLELLTELGLESTAIDAAPCAVFRPFERYLRRAEDRDQVNVFVDIGWSSTRITISRSNRIAFTKSFDGGGARFNALVAEALSVEWGAAGELRRLVAAGRREHEGPVSLVDQATADAVNGAVRPALDQLGKEIGLCLRYFAVTFRGPKPESVTCVGGESLDPGCLKHLSEATGLPCRVGHPLRGLDCAEALPDVEAGSSMADWTTVAGLAMRMARPAVAAA